MEKNFEDILESLLEEFEKNPNQDIDVFIMNKAKELNFDGEQLTLLTETNMLLQKYDEANKDLQKFKEETGMSRSAWLTGSLEETFTKNGITGENLEKTMENLSESVRDINVYNYSTYSEMHDKQ